MASNGLIEQGGMDEFSGIEVLERVHLLRAGLWRRRYVIGVPMVIFPVLALIYAWSTPQTFRTHMTILVQESSKHNPTLKDLTVGTNLEERMPALRALVHSRHILLQVGEYLGDVTSRSSDYERGVYVADLASRLSVDLYGSDTVRLGLVGGDPRELDDTLSAVGRFFIVRIVAPENSAIVGSKTFLEQQLAQRKVELDKSAQALADFKSRHAAELPQLHHSNVERLSSLRQQQSEKRSELAGVEAELSAMRQKIGQANPLLGALESELVALKAERAKLQARYTDEHSEIKSLTRQIERLETERLEIIRSSKPLSEEDLDRLFNILANSQPVKDDEARPFLTAQVEKLHLTRQRVVSLRQELSEIENSITELNQQIAALGDMERRLHAYEKDFGLKEKIYTDLLQRYEMASITRELGQFEEGERIKIIDAPYEPHSQSDGDDPHHLQECLWTAGSRSGDDGDRHGAAVDPVATDLPALLRLFRPDRSHRRRPHHQGPQQGA